MQLGLGILRPPGRFQKTAEAENLWATASPSSPHLTPPTVSTQEQDGQEGAQGAALSLAQHCQLGCASEPLGNFQKFQSPSHTPDYLTAVTSGTQMEPFLKPHPK